MSIAQNVVVRARKTDDLRALADALRRVHALDGYPVEGVADPEVWMTPHGELASWTAEINGHPIGHICLVRATSADDAAQVWADATGGNVQDLAIPVRLFIDPNHRSQGAAYSLMVIAAAHAAQNGMHIAFDVMLKDVQAIRLYERLGCQRLGAVTHHHSSGLAEPAAVYSAPAAGSIRAL